jgi:hypothetical protein
MPRRCTVCAHDESHQIDVALVRREPYRHIATRFGVSTGALQRHSREHIPRLLLRAREATEAADAERLRAELDRCFERVNLLFDACDRWLRDPDDPERYDVGPRAEEMRVSYADADGSRHKATLAELLSRVEGGAGVDVAMVETKHADPRELILKTAARLQPQIELLAKLVSELDERPTLNVLISPEWLELRAAIVGALELHSEARGAVLQAIAGVSNGHARR